ncbi:MAG: DUF2934 domain-containing protein [Alphaproteobacteria bacterium]|nr:DUF2934 domain-containing protein [Alphaproteobacteria bacterium]MBF0128764.1 DUF2934 domain-containing protein [Alphaproteobacteria bacterium]
METISMGMELLERIREKAYQLWEAEGCSHGRDMEYWFRAEALVSQEQTGELFPHTVAPSVSAKPTPKPTPKPDAKKPAPKPDAKKPAATKAAAKPAAKSSTKSSPASGAKTAKA